jgi:hypothetical protein
VVQELLRLQIQEEAAAASYQPLLVEDFPKERFNAPDFNADVILYSVVSSEIAGMAPNGVDRKPTGISLFEKRDHPTKAGYKLVQYGWQEMAVVEFSIIGKTNKRANEVCNWFHSAMMWWGHGEEFFKANGISFFKFLHRLPDQRITSESFGQELYERSLRYQIRVSYINWAESKTLEKINVTVGLQDSAGGPIKGITSDIWSLDPNQQ